MSEDFNVIGFYLTSNMDISLHDQDQLQYLVKKKVINKKILEYNSQLNHYLKSFKIDQRQSEEFKAKYKKFTKQINKIDQLNEIDRISILNNTFANQSQLILKIQSCENITAKQRKIILENVIRK